MKQFDPNKPYCRRDGKPAKIVYTFKDGTYLVVYDWRDGVKELTYRVNQDGYYRENAHCGHREHEADLVNIPEKIEGWQNIYKTEWGRGYTGKDIYFTKEDALNNADKDSVACIKVFFTEGEGL